MEAVSFTGGASEIRTGGDGLLEEGVVSVLSTIGGAEVTVGGAAEGAEAGAASEGDADTAGSWAASSGAAGGLNVRVITAGGDAISFCRF